MHVHLETLPRLRVLLDGEEFEQVLRQPVRIALLLYLAVERDATHDAAMALLWPERDTARGRHALSQTVYELRRTLGRDWVRMTGGRLRVHKRVTVDALEVEAALHDGDCDRALKLYRGPILPGWSSFVSSELDAWVDGKRARLSRLLGDVCRRKAEALADQGDLEAAADLVRRWVDVEPADRKGRTLLVRLLMRNGDTTGAEEECGAFDDWLRGAGLERDERDQLLADLRALVETCNREVQTPGATPLDSDRHPRPRVIVLPFEHLGAAEDRYLTEGVTDEVTARLARIPSLAVIARTSAIRYREPAGAIERVGRDLDVDYAVQGTIRLDRTRGRVQIRINSGLIRVRDATHLWADSQQAVLGDVFRLQEEVAEKVAEAIGVRLPPLQEGSVPPTERLDAYELFLRGRQRWFERTPVSIRAAIDLFQQAVALDPRYARAYAGLAEAYAMMPAFGQAQPREWHPQAKRLAEHALTLDPESAEAHSAAGIVAYVYDWDFRAAERHLSRACELVSSHAPAHVWRAYVLLTTGRPEEAARVMDRGHDLDPVSVATNWDAGFHAWLRDDPQHALEQFARVLELNPRFDYAMFMLGGIRYLRGDVAGAAEKWRKIARFGPPWPQFVERLEDAARAVRFLDRWIEIAPRPVYWYVVAVLYALLERPEQAFHWLDGHYQNVRGLPGRLETSGANLAYAAHDPFFRRLRAYPPFNELMGRIGVPRR